MNTQILKIKQGATVPRIPLPHFTHFKALRKVALSARAELRHLGFEKVLMRIVIGAVVLDLILGMFILIRIYMPVSTFENTAFAAFAEPGATATLVGSETQSLVHNLHAQGLSAGVVGETTRQDINTPATLLSVDGDTILAFEYGEVSGAQEGATLLRERYVAPKRTGVWQDRAHVYVHDSLVLFYIGTNEKIISALETHTGVEKE
ncbi:MAG: hypothetical protein KA052_00600 [Candidatus Pacebacteria bacterium]|nr:hypothetical protein [Candidatus Paceibacterota bacterium]